MEIIDKVLSALKGINFLCSLIEILIIFWIVYFILRILKENNAKGVIWLYIIGTVLVGILLLVKKVEYGGLYMIALQCVFAISVMVMFATEVKRAIWNRRITSEFRHGDGSGSVNDVNTCIEEIIKAVQNMSKNDVGSIIILSNGNLPNGVLESGVLLNADISSQLVESIFFPKSSLHDGAMILYGTKIQAAGCFLPLAQEVNLSKDLGSRHRAGIGLTETVNVTAIIVSEESGIISIAKGGKLIRYVDTNVLRETLKLFYWQDLID